MKTVYACEQCNKVKEAYKTKSNACRFCSRECSFYFFKGKEKNVVPLEKRKWHKNSKGYMQTTVRRKRVYQHRYIIENAIGRKLENHEIIHHINGIKTDNRIENLHITNSKEHKLGYGDAFMDGYKKCLEDIKNMVGD